jgi:hypothetical protein
MSSISDLYIETQVKAVLSQVFVESTTVPHSLDELARLFISLLDDCDIDLVPR